ncbi:hypothetical protein BS78_07G179600 [Paspalum vaginatum]|nr:hypothetical protein BS78_07G179600 [Paspalum vaginatum]
MGIVKIARGEPAARSGYSCGEEDLTQDDRVLLQSFPSHECLDSEHAEVGCELAMSRGQMCNVPYGLYDLHELTEVLSLETWNSCLTEDDRLCLAAYLPDMEQHDFVTTMKELFRGDDMFFGSPLRSFFLRLNGGLYSPQVSQARELLMRLQRRRHYHSLKLYHNSMVGKFASMHKLLRSSDSSASVRDKVPTTRNQIYEKHFSCVGTSSATVPITIKDETVTVSPMKRAKLMDGSFRHNETSKVAKSTETYALESQISHPLSDSRQNCSKLPKGVLKIRTGCASPIYSSEGIHHRPGLILVDQLGMQSSGFYTPPHVFAHDAHGFSENLSCVNTINGTSASSQCSSLQWKGTPEPYVLMGKSPLGVHLTVPEVHNSVYPSMVLRSFYQPAANHSLAHPSEAYDTRECGHMKDFLKNFGHQNRIVHQSSPDPHPRVSDDHQMNVYTTRHSLRDAENISEMLNLGTRICPSHSNFPEQLETMCKYHDGMKLEVSPAKPVTKAEEARQFSYTYARRKPHKSSTMAEDTASPGVVDSMANIEAKAIKL